MIHPKHADAIDILLSLKEKFNEPKLNSLVDSLGLFSSLDNYAAREYINLFQQQFMNNESTLNLSYWTKLDNLHKNLIWHYPEAEDDVNVYIKHKFFSADISDLEIFSVDSDINSLVDCLIHACGLLYFIRSNLTKIADPSLAEFIDDKITSLNQAVTDKFGRVSSSDKVIEYVSLCETYAVACQEGEEETKTAKSIKNKIDSIWDTLSRAEQFAASHIIVGIELEQELLAGLMKGKNG